MVGLLKSLGTLHILTFSANVFGVIGRRSQQEGGGGWKLPLSQVS